MHLACGTLIDGAVQMCLDVGTHSQQASLGDAAGKWITSCITVQASKSVWFKQRYMQTILLFDRLENKVSLPVDAHR